MAQALTEGTQSASGSTARITNVVLWVLQIAAAGMFLMVGFLKLSGNAQLVGLFQAIGFGQWFRYLTGMVEVAGAILLLIPRTSGLAALMLAGAMTCAGLVTPEYNHRTSGALKNAIDFLYHEWVNKAAGFVGYGGASGTRAVENLRLVMGELQIADVKAQVGISLFTDFENFSIFKPAPQQEQSVNAMLDQVIAWGGALKTLRKK